MTGYYRQAYQEASIKTVRKRLFCVSVCALQLGLQAFWADKRISVGLAASCPWRPSVHKTPTLGIHAYSRWNEFLDSLPQPICALLRLCKYRADTPLKIPGYEVTTGSRATR